MGRRIYYNRSKIIGYKRDDKGHLQFAAEDDFIHQRNQDPILMACKRSNDMAGCEKFDVDTVPAFSRWVDDVIMNFVPYRSMAVPEYEW